MEEQHRPTIFDIARLAGVSYATVSRALNNRSRVSKATRSKVLSIARQLKYRPDPMLTALCKYRRAVKEHPVSASLAYFTDSTRSIRKQPYNELFNGARARAEALGYHLDNIWTNQPNLTAKRLTHILKNRGIEGILVSPLIQEKSNHEIHLDWSQFAAVTIAYSLRSPRLHRVCGDYFFSVQEILRQLDIRGYRHPCLFITRHVLERNNYRWLAAYLIEQQASGIKSKRSYYILETHGGVHYGDLFSRWWGELREKPDALIFVDGNTARVCLSKMGWTYPDDIGIALLSGREDNTQFSGIRTSHYKIGETAISTLVSLLHSNQHGVPDQAQTISVEGVWWEGRTLRPFPAGARKQLESPLPKVFGRGLR